MTVLQWGRGFSATEGSNRDVNAHRNTSLQWGRGFSATEGRSARRGRCRGRRCFNGAVASQPRKEKVPNTGNSRITGFNGAVASQPRKASGRGNGGFRDSSFNGAVASQPRKGPPVRGDARDGEGLQWGRGFSATEGSRGTWGSTSVLTASMGPWLLSHGRDPSDREDESACEASMGPWLLSHGRGPPRGRSRTNTRCFNGAVASQPRKGFFSLFRRFASIRLQWGRGFSATEGVDGTGTPTSLGTLQWGRGFSATEGPAPLGKAPRGGHASMGPWLLSHGRGRRVVEGQRPRSASMGPWLLSHGRTHFPRGISGRLQASMGPWLLSHGRDQSTSVERLSKSASMGPWLLSHGRVATFSGAWSKDTLLQWGRGFSATEGGSTEVVSYQGARTPVASTPAFPRLPATRVIIPFTVNRFTPGN